MLKEIVLAIWGLASGEGFRLGTLYAGLVASSVFLYACIAGVGVAKGVFMALTNNATKVAIVAAHGYAWDALRRRRALPQAEVVPGRRQGVAEAAVSRLLAATENPVPGVVL